MPSDPLEAKRLKYKATRYLVLSEELYRRGYSRVLQRCVGAEGAEGILKDIHSGSCRNHTGGVTLAHKALRQGFYWSTLFADAKRTTVEAEPLVHITETNTTNFVKKNILYKFGIPNTIITDNGTQFDNKKFKELCKKYGINNYYASPAHPQINGQTEAMNKIIKHNLKAKLAVKKGNWAEKLS
ncbi:hypothetical protein Q3G72_001372 [Acer saccharum]|nr:hypothetical protein Q3G72_001372 [Acer saccharum]